MRASLKKRNATIRQLSTGATKKFFHQEVFGGSSEMKYYLLATMLFIVLGDIAQSIALNIDNGSFLHGYEIWMVNIPMVVGYLAFSIFFINKLDKLLSNPILRFLVLLIANIALSITAAAHIYYYFKKMPALLQETEMIYRGICVFTMGIYTCLLVDMITPYWYLKALVPLSYFVGMIYGLNELNLNKFAAGWISSLLGCLNILLLCWIKAHFRWKIFLNKAREEDWNQINDLILNRVPNPIAVFTSNGEIEWCNNGFESLARSDLKGFLTKIVKLKRRRNMAYHNNDESSLRNDSHIKIEKSFSLLDESKFSKRPPPPPPKGLQRAKTNAFSAVIEEAEDLQDLLTKVRKLVGEGKMYGDYLVFDGKMSDPLLKQYHAPTYEVTLSFASEYQKIVLLLRDTTEHARIVTLETNSQYKDKLLASVSHELKTPLNANLTFIDSALSNEEVPQTIKEQLLSPALISGKLLLHLINDILDYYQIASKKLQLNFAESNIRETIKTCYQLMEQQISPKRLDYICQIDDDVPEYFTTDHDRVKQIILNLLSNAAKFTFQGSIKIKARMTADAHLKISVEDTGIGIKKVDMKKLFHEFTRIDSNEHNTVDNSKGVGLGLTIASKIARRLGPDTKDAGISVDSTHGRGSIFAFIIKDKSKERVRRSIFEESLESPKPKDFTMTFIKGYSEETVTAGLEEEITVENASRYQFNPHNRTAITITDFNVTARTIGGFGTATTTARRLLDVEGSSNFDLPAMTPKLSSKRKKRLLIVDDDQFNILAMKSLLKKYEFDIDCAYNGQEAVDKVSYVLKNVEQQPYDLIFMDCQMPIMDGYEASKVLTELMNRKTMPDTPIVACTAFGGKQRIEMCYQAGMKDVINKPLSRTKVEQVLKTFLNISE